MKTSYDKSTDSLYIELRALPSSRTVQIADDIMVDYGSDGEPVGYDIQHASTKADLIARVILEDLPQLQPMKDEYDFSKFNWRRINGGGPRWWSGKTAF